jgi:hypothetical protein
MPSRPAPVPPGDLSRKLTAARPDHDQSPPHLRLVGDTSTVLVTGEETAGKHTLIDMHVPPGGGPRPHRHDFEELTSPADQFKERTIAAFRASHGRVGDTFDGAPLLLTRHEPPAPVAGGMDRRMLRALVRVTACRHPMPVALGHGLRVLRS